MQLKKEAKSSFPVGAKQQHVIRDTTTHVKISATRDKSALRRNALRWTEICDLEHSKCVTLLSSLTQHHLLLPPRWVNRLSHYCASAELSAERNETIVKIFNRGV